MTRLATHHIAHIPGHGTTHAVQLKTATGLSLLGLAAQATGQQASRLAAACTGKRVGIIPISSGEGYIAGFSEALAAIATSMGFHPTILPADQEGFDMAHTVDMLLWADDHNYMAQNTRTGTKAENGDATGRGFAVALHAMLERQHKPVQTVVVRGCGPVGTAAGHMLRRLGHRVIPCDLLPHRAEALAHQLHADHPQWATPHTLHSVVTHVDALLDAAPNAEFLPSDLLTPYAVVAAPGVPCVWPRTLLPTQLFWHDPLETGTAVMLAQAGGTA